MARSKRGSATSDAIVTSMESVLYVGSTALAGGPGVVQAVRRIKPSVAW
jgi:hypothetical protein